MPGVPEIEKQECKLVAVTKNPKKRKIRKNQTTELLITLPKKIQLEINEINIPK